MKPLDMVLHQIGDDALGIVRTPIQFPTSKIAPPQDPTELDLHTVCRIARDFDDAIKAAGSPARAAQLYDRIVACIGMLVDVEERAIQKRNFLNLPPLPESWKPLVKESK